MRKMRIALVILLFLAVITLSQTGMALTTISPQSLGASIGVGSSMPTLGNIQQQLASSGSTIAGTSQELTALTNSMVAQSMANAANDISMEQNTASAYNPSMVQGMSVPTSGIADAIKQLGSTKVAFESPQSALQSMKIPTLAVYN
jgi:hypothetical protein